MAETMILRVVAIIKKILSLVKGVFEVQRHLRKPSAPKAGEIKCIIGREPGMVAAWRERLWPGRRSKFKVRQPSRWPRRRRDSVLLTLGAAEQASPRHWLRRSSEADHCRSSPESRFCGWTGRWDCFGHAEAGLRSRAPA